MEMLLKEFRENIKEMYEKLPLFLMKKWGKAEERKLTDSIKLEIKNENYLKLLHAQYLMDENTMSDFALRFRNKIWTFGYECNKQQRDRNCMSTLMIVFIIHSTF